MAAASANRAISGTWRMGGILLEERLERRSIGQRRGADRPAVVARVPFAVVRRGPEARLPPSGRILDARHDAATPSCCDDVPGGSCAELPPGTVDAASHAA